MLKTLNDMGFTIIEDDGEKHEFVRKIELKVEAMEWIKSFERNAITLINKEEFSDAKGNAMAASMFKIFFNIDGDDLNET